MVPPRGPSGSPWSYLSYLVTLMKNALRSLLSEVAARQTAKSLTAQNMSFLN